MTKESCADFAKAMTTVREITVNDYRVTSLFEKYSKTMGSRNIILLEEFLQFYTD